MDMKSFLRLSVAMLCTVMAVPAFAGFGASVTDLGKITGDFTVNQLVTTNLGTELKTSANSTIVRTDPGTYATTTGFGKFFLYRVDVFSIPDGTFSATFRESVLAIVASNSFTSKPGLTFDVLAKFESEVPIPFVDPSLPNGNLGGNNANGLEILDFNPQNPDFLLVAGNTVSGDVTRTSGLQGSREAFYVLTAVPEPASVAVWGVCGIGCIVAGRRRLRKQNA
jgi:hypothetical protein